MGGVKRAAHLPARRDFMRGLPAFHAAHVRLSPDPGRHRRASPAAGKAIAYVQRLREHRIRIKHIRYPALVRASQPRIAQGENKKSIAADLGISRRALYSALDS